MKFDILSPSGAQKQDEKAGDLTCYGGDSRTGNGRVCACDVSDDMHKMSKSLEECNITEERFKKESAKQSLQWAEIMLQWL